MRSFLWINAITYFMDIFCKITWKMYIVIAARKGGSLSESLNRSKTDVRLGEMSWKFLEVKTFCSIFRLFYLGKESLYLTATSGHFKALRECLSSCQSTSSKEKFWPIDEFRVTETRIVPNLPTNKFQSKM